MRIDIAGPSTCFDTGGPSRFIDIDPGPSRFTDKDPGASRMAEEKDDE